MPTLHQRVCDSLRALGIQFTEDAAGSIRVAARHPAVGDLVVEFDGGEATVCVGRITHSHFTPVPRDGGSVSDSEAIAADEAARYFADILSDRTVVWCIPGVAGGSYSRDHSSESAIQAGELRFVWSGPIE